MLRVDRKQQNYVKQLSFNKKLINLKKLLISTESTDWERLSATQLSDGGQVGPRGLKVLFGRRDHSCPRTGGKKKNQIIFEHLYYHVYVKQCVLVAQ